MPTNTGPRHINQILDDVLSDIEAKAEKSRERRRAYYLANKGKISERNRKYRAENLEKAREYQIEYRAKNKQKAREYHQVWRALNPEKLLKHRRKSYVVTRERRLEYARKYCAANAIQRRESRRENRNGSSMKFLAQSKINNLQRSGRLSSPYVCEQCHVVGQIDAHHDDYSKPLEIRWLCRRCHQRYHAEHGEAPNGATPWYYKIEKRYKLRKKDLRVIIASISQEIPSSLDVGIIHL